MEYVNEGTVLGQSEPVLKYFDSNPNNVKHPFIVAAVEYCGAIPIYYCFQMASRIDNAVNQMDYIPFQPAISSVDGKNIDYNNEQQTTTYINCSNIHVLSKERLNQCYIIGFLKPNMRDTIEKIAARHSFLQDYALAPKDESTDIFLVHIGQTRESLRTRKDYQNFKEIIQDPIYKEIIIKKRMHAREEQSIYLRKLQEYMEDFRNYSETESRGMGR